MSRAVACFDLMVPKSVESMNWEIKLPKPGLPPYQARPGTLADNIVKILEAKGSPMHARDIASSARRGATGCAGIIGWYRYVWPNEYHDAKAQVGLQHRLQPVGQADRLPDQHGERGEQDECRPQGGDQQCAILFQIGKGDERDHDRGCDVAERNRDKYDAEPEQKNDSADHALRGLEWGWPARTNKALEVSQQRDGSFDQSDDATRWKMKRSDAVRENRSASRKYHLRGGHREQRSRQNRYSWNQTEESQEKQHDAKRAAFKAADEPPERYAIRWGGANQSAQHHGSRHERCAKLIYCS
jgi:hypothetical protein